jgi:hypothetical protein
MTEPVIMQVLRFTFENATHYLGVAVLLGIIASGIGGLMRRRDP